MCGARTLRWVVGLAALSVSVATPLGWMVFTRIECSASWLAHTCISATSARLEAA